MPQLGPTNTDPEERITTDETINLEFEGFSPVESDANGIQKLLDQLFLKYPVDTCELATYLIENNQVGTVVKNIPAENVGGELEDDTAADSDDDIVFSITSVINLSLDREKHCVQQIVEFLKSNCATGDAGGSSIIKLLNALDTAKVGLLLNERVVNLPTQLTLQPMEALITEMKAANSRQKRYEFTHFLMLCKARRILVEQRPGKRPKAEFIFTNIEDDIILDESDSATNFSVSDTSAVPCNGDSEDGAPYRTVLVFTADKFNHIISKIKNTVI